MITNKQTKFDDEYEDMVCGEIERLDPNIPDDVRLPLSLPLFLSYCLPVLLHPSQRFVAQNALPPPPSHPNPLRPCNPYQTQAVKLKRWYAVLERAQDRLQPWRARTAGGTWLVRCTRAPAAAAAAVGRGDESQQQRQQRQQQQFIDVHVPRERYLTPICASVFNLRVVAALERNAVPELTRGANMLVRAKQSHRPDMCLGLLPAGDSQP
jgi:hypothetical protein